MKDTGIELEYLGEILVSFGHIVIDATGCSVQRQKKAAPMLQRKEKATYCQRANRD